MSIKKNNSISSKINERSFNKKDKVGDELIEYVKENPVKKKKSSVNYKSKKLGLKKHLHKININYKFKKHMSIKKIKLFLLKVN